MVTNKNKIVSRVNRALAKCGLPEAAKELPIEWKTFRGNIMGLATCDTQGNQTVTMDERYYGQAHIKKAESIYAHELIHHALADAKIQEGPHGKMFRRVALTAGLKDFGDHTWRYQWTCPVCKWWVKTHQKGKLRLCTHCQPITETKTMIRNGVRYQATTTMRVALKCKKILSVSVNAGQQE